MKRKFLTTAIAALALMVTFNSCKKDDDKPSFPAEDIKLLIDDGRVFAKQDSLRDEYFYSGEKEGYSDRIAVGTSPDNLGSISLSDVEPFTKYYWCVRVRDRKNPNPDEYIESEVRSFYYVTPPQITKIYNVEGDWAAIVKWEQSDYMKATKLTLTPDKDCKYDNTPIDLSAMTDSCYISAGSEFDSKYAVYHQWWNDSKAQYYEPVVYGFNVVYEGEIDGHSFSVTSDTAKYIFLDRAKYAADMQFNVYRMGQIGNYTWLLEDLRGYVVNHIPDKEHDYSYYTSLQLTSPIGFKARAYCYDVMDYKSIYSQIIPEGFHLATDGEWQDLEYTYGTEKKHNSNYTIWDGHLSNYAYTYYYKDAYDFYTKDTISYIGQKNQLLYKVISDKEWIKPDSIKTPLNGEGTFNIRPYGVAEQQNATQGFAAAYLTSTFNYNEDTPQCIIRFFWGGNTGVARVCKNKPWNDYYMFRCVKNN